MTKRLILVLTVTALMLIGSALPAMAQRYAEEEAVEEPRTPSCDWYANWDEEEEWWEYWCYWPRWGWEYVFWSY